MAAHVCLCELFLFSFSWLVENESYWVAKGDLDLPPPLPRCWGYRCVPHTQPELPLLITAVKLNLFFFLMSAAKDEDPSLQKGIVCRSALFLTVCRDCEDCEIVHTLVCGLLPGVDREEGWAFRLMVVSMWRLR